jgi:hypothetical protein
MALHTAVLTSTQFGGYLPIITEKKVIGIGVLIDSGESRNYRTSLAASSFVPPSMAARLRGRKTRRLSSAVTGTPTRSSRRPSLAWGASAFQSTVRRPVMAIQSTGAPAPLRLKTSFIKFLPCNSDSEALFSVNPDIPALDALEQASRFIGTAREIAAVSAEDLNTEAPWATVYLLDMAMAIVDSVIETIVDENRRALDNSKRGAR